MNLSDCAKYFCKLPVLTHVDVKRTALARAQHSAAKVAYYRIIEALAKVKVSKWKRIAEEEYKKATKEPDNKWIVHFQEFEKGMVLNWTNIQLVAKALDSEETNDWIGRQIVIFEDPNVSFGGELVGGIRVRAVKKTAEMKPASPDPDDEIPF